MIIEVVSKDAAVAADDINAAPVLIELEEEEDGVKGVGEAELDTIALLVKDDFFLLSVEKDEFCTSIADDEEEEEEEEEEPTSPLPPPVLAV